MLLFGFPLPSPVRKEYWHCNHCETNWTDDKSEGPDNDA